MTTISLRIPHSLHLAAKSIAEQEGVSMNQLITLALAEKISALATEDYLAQRAARGNREKFLAAMAQVPDAAPELDEDRLPD